MNGPSINKVSSHNSTYHSRVSKNTSRVTVLSGTPFLPTGVAKLAINCGDHFQASTGYQAGENWREAAKRLSDNYLGQAEYLTLASR